jgi:hypothetical protein
MKRSCAGEDNSPIIKKKVREEEKKINTTNTSTTNSTATTESISSTKESTITITTLEETLTPSTPTPTDNMSVLEYIHNLVHNLEQGNIDHCLSSTNNSTDLTEQLNTRDSDLFNALESNLKKIAQRQLQLETENLRCRIMIQQQHQLLTTNHEKVTQPTPSIPKTTTNKEEATSEDNLTSVQDISLLEKLENSYRQMPNTVPELPQGGYFGK